MQRDYGIEGTPIFDGTMAQAGYALNRMCYSFNSADNRAEFRRDENAYCRKYGLGEAQRSAVAHRNVLELIAAGGNIYFLAKIGATDGFSFQNLASKMTGVPEDEYKAMMIAGGRSVQGNRSKTDKSK